MHRDRRRAMFLFILIPFLSVQDAGCGLLAVGSGHWSSQELGHIDSSKKISHDWDFNLGVINRLHCIPSRVFGNASKW